MNLVYKRIFLTILNLPFLAYAQPISEMYEHLNRSTLISHEHIRLLLPGGDSTLKAFAHKVSKLADGRISDLNLVHIGGSHVQGGVLPNTVRNNLVHLHPSFFGDRGLLFPFKLAGTNNPQDFKINFTGSWIGHRTSVNSDFAEFGICGITATTYDPEATFAVQLMPFNGREYLYDRIRIYHPFGPEYMKPVWNGKENLLITWENPSAGFTEFVFEYPISSNQFILRSYLDSAQKFVIQGIQFFLEKPSLVYHAIGVNGATTSSYLRSDAFTKQIRYLRADMVIFGIGINDANVPQGKFDQELFKANYERLMNAFRRGNRTVFFIFLTNTDSYYQRKYPNRNALLAREALMELAEKHQAGVIDVLEIMGGIGSSRQWKQAGLMTADMIHLTPRGYTLVGHAISAAIIRALAEVTKSELNNL